MFTKTKNSELLVRISPSLHDSQSLMVTMCRGRERGKTKPLVCLRCAQAVWKNSNIPLWCQPAQQGLHDGYGDGDNLDMMRRRGNEVGL